MKTILHCDANNFYASVEIKLNPSLADKPIAVSGNPEKRHGIILAKSTIAKQFGVKTGDTIWQAKKKCPDLILLLPNHAEYAKYSKLLFNLYTEYTDKVEPFGIDECWLDCSNSLKLFKSGEEIANTLRRRVKEEIGITISVGVSFTKIFAKLGSDLKKPDATNIINLENYKTIAWNLPVSDLLMVGSQTKKKLDFLNVRTIGDLACFNKELLISHLGINGATLHDYANGIENDNIRYYYNNHIPKSVGNSTTTPIDLTSLSEATAVIVGLSELIATRLRKHALIVGGVSLYLKFKDLTGNGKQVSLAISTNNAKDIANESLKILQEIHTFSTNMPIRAIAINTFKLENESNNRQINMFEKMNNRSEKLENTVDSIREKYGFSILKKGIVFAHPDICGDLLDDEKFLPFQK